MPVTDSKMTRFWITLEQGVDFVLMALKKTQGGDFVPKIPSMKILDLAKAIGPDCKIKEIGIRPGEKIHEVLISKSDAQNTIEFQDYYIVEPQFKWWSTDEDYLKDGKSVNKDFVYSSDVNTKWLDALDIQDIIKVLIKSIINDSVRLNKV